MALAVGRDEGAPLREKLALIALAVLIGMALVTGTVAADGWVWLTQPLSIL